MSNDTAGKIKSRSQGEISITNPACIGACERQPARWYRGTLSYERSTARIIWRLHRCQERTLSHISSDVAHSFTSWRGVRARQPERQESIKKCRFSGRKERNWRRSNLSPHEGPRERARLGTARARARPLSRQIPRYGEFPYEDFILDIPTDRPTPTDTFLGGCFQHDVTRRRSHCRESPNTKW